MSSYILVETDEHYAAAASLFKEYADWLQIDLCFQGFNTELQNLRLMYGAPAGGIILYKVDQEFRGCVAVRRQERDIAELKRMYVQREYRNKGVGLALLKEALQLARICGYKKIRLDTLNSMTSAIKLYKQHGFYEIPAYYHNPESTALYLEAVL